MEEEKAGSLRDALQPEALKAALRPRRPVFRDPWDSSVDMFFSYLAVSVIVPVLLFCGAELMSLIFGVDSRWPLSVFMAAGLVGTAGFITIVGRERISLSVDLVAIAAWLVLGLLVAPLLGLALPAGVALASYGVVLVLIFFLVRRFGRWETDFRRTLSWPVTWSLLAVFFAYIWYALVLYT